MGVGMGPVGGRDQAGQRAEGLPTVGEGAGAPAREDAVLLRGIDVAEPTRPLVEEGAGPLVGLVDESLVIEGQFDKAGEVRAFRRVPAAAFVSLEATITVDATSAARAGMFVAREQDRRGTRTTSAMVRVLRHKDGALQTHLLRSGRPDLGPQDVTWLDFPTDTPVRLRIERAGPETAAVVNVYVDGTPILVSAPMSSFGKTMSDVNLGFFVEGESGRRVRLTVDDVEIVRRRG